MAEHVVILNQAQLEEILSRALDHIRTQLTAARLCDDCRINLRAALNPDPTVDLTKPVCSCAQVETTTLDATEPTYIRGEPDPDCPVHPDDCCPDCRHPWYQHSRGGCMGCWLGPDRTRSACIATRPAKGGA